MTASAEQVTIATSSGAMWLALIMHFGAGLLALGGGLVAVVATKGGQAHRRAGMVFVVTMIVLMVFAAIIYAWTDRYASVISTILPAYLVFTALTTVKPIIGKHERTVSIALMLLVFSNALNAFWWGNVALNSPNKSLGGVPAGMFLFLGFAAFIAAIGDWRLLRAGSITGSRRLARHLWRMCFALFIATGSFFLGQMNFIPQPVRSLPLLFALGLSPLVVLLYWMWRIRLRKKMQGIVLRVPAATQPIS